MTITLDPDMEARLREKALREGQEPDVVAKMLLADVLEANAREHQESVAAIHEALKYGPGRPIEQYLAEQRVKHGYPNAWPARGVAREIAPGVFADGE
jgi:hypothetical protein